jgi:hypothetical protein
MAAEMALMWSSEGRHVVLADAGLGGATLHAALNMPNGEGLSDAVEWGASVGRVARPVEGVPYFLVSAGTAVADPASVLEGARWAELCAGFRESGATLVVFVPSSEGTRRAVLAEATDVFVLATEADVPTADFGGAADRVRGVVGWEAAREVEPEPAPEEPGTPAEAPAWTLDVAPVLAWEAPRVAASLEAPPVVFPPPADSDRGAPTSMPPDADPAEPFSPAVESVAPLPKGAHAAEALRGAASSPAGAARYDALARGFQPLEVGGSSRRRNLVLAIVLVIVLALIAVARFGFITIPGITPTGG